MSHTKWQDLMTRVLCLSEILAGAESSVHEQSSYEVTSHHKGHGVRVRSGEQAMLQSSHRSQKVVKRKA